LISVKYPFKKKEFRCSLPNCNQLLLLSFLALPSRNNSIFDFLCQVFLRTLLIGRRVERLCFEQSPLLWIVSLRICLGLGHPSESYHLLKVDWNWLHWHHRWWLWIHLRNHSHFLHDLPLLLSYGLANALLFKFRKDFLLGFWKSRKSAFLSSYVNGTVIFIFELSCSWVLRRIVIRPGTTLVFKSEKGLVLISGRKGSFWLKRLVDPNGRSCQIFEIQFKLWLFTLSFLKLHNELITNKSLFSLSFRLLFFHDHFHKFPCFSFLDMSSSFCFHLVLLFYFSFFFIVNPLLPISRNFLDSQIVFLELILHSWVINVCKVANVRNYLV